MSVQEHLEKLTKHSLEGRTEAFYDQLNELASYLDPLSPAEKSAGLAEIFELIGENCDGLAANLALLAGAIVERGHEPEGLSRALLAPITRGLSLAARFVERAQREPECDDDDAVDIGNHQISRASVETIQAEDEQAVAAFFSFDIWYRPAVAAFSRAPSVLRDLQKTPALSEALAVIDAASEGFYWLTVLIGSSIEQSFILLFAELDEGYRVTVDGVSDCGQLSALLSEPLREPLARIGVTKTASTEMLAVMSGAGPQQNERASYGCDFHLYPWQAMDPQTGRPKDERFWWRALSGGGNHSLPGDFNRAPSSRSTVSGYCFWWDRKTRKR
jgi:hypothetical protein